jgi:hypothetical protein
VESPERGRARDTVVVDVHVDNGVVGAVDAWCVVVYNGDKGMGLVVWEVSFVVLGV